MSDAVASIFGGIFKGGSDIAAAKISADASTKNTAAQIAATKEAADIQAKTAADALDYLKQRVATGEANMQPYINIGSNAGSKLSDFMGFPISTSTAASTATKASTTTPAVANDTTTINFPAFAQAMNGAPSAQVANLKDLSTLASDTTAPSTTSVATNSTAAPATASVSSDDAPVWMVAPDGSVKQVKSSQVDGYLAKGAKLLSGGDSSQRAPSLAAA